MSDSKESITSEILVMAGKEGSMLLEENSMHVQCLPSGKNAFYLKLNIKGPHSSLQSNVRVIEGERFSLGQTLRQFNARNRQIDTSDGVTVRSQGPGQTLYNYDLYVFKR